MPTGYCTVDDVRRALRAKDLPGDAAQDKDIVVDAIAGQTRWLQSTTNAHFYEPNGISEDSISLIPTSTIEQGPEELDVPSTPHPQHSTMWSSRRDWYPHRTNGPYCRIPLAKHGADTITTLEVRDAGGSFTDWTTDASKVAGDDYELFVDAAPDTPSDSHLNLRAASLPAIQHFDNAVRVTYSYGVDKIPRTIRRAVAMRAAAQLLTDDEASLGIPESTSMVSAESKVQAMERQAEELLEGYV